MSKAKSEPQQPDAPFTASDVKRVAGLSYRQLNDWDAKGALPNSREGDEGWRTFSLRELFILLLCCEIRKKFGTPLEKLRWLQQLMLNQKADHFRYAFEMMSHGLCVLLLTDLERILVMSTDLDFEDKFRHGYFRGERGQLFILFEVNPLVNSLLAQLDEPFHLPTKDELYLQIEKTRSARTAQVSPEEKAVLKLIRQGNFHTVTVRKKDGRIMQVDAEEEFGERVKQEKDILEILKSDAFLSLTVVKQNGKIVRVSRKKPFKTGVVTERR